MSHDTELKQDNAVRSRTAHGGRVAESISLAPRPEETRFALDTPSLLDHLSDDD